VGSPEGRVPEASAGESIRVEPHEEAGVGPTLYRVGFAREKLRSAGDCCVAGCATFVPLSAPEVR
jgi:hypothetical protein